MPVHNVNLQLADSRLVSPATFHATAQIFVVHVLAHMFACTRASSTRFRRCTSWCRRRTRKRGSLRVVQCLPGCSAPSWPSNALLDTRCPSGCSVLSLLFGALVAVRRPPSSEEDLNALSAQCFLDHGSGNHEGVTVERKGWWDTEWPGVECAELPVGRRPTKSASYGQ